MSPKKADPCPPLPGAIWLRPRPRTRARGSLDQTGIARAAVELLDEAGPARLSLRAIAARLDVHATSLYWHVAGRDDLLDLAVDAIFGEIALPTTPPGDDWVDDISRFTDELRAALLRHPWSGALAASRPLLGPEALQRSESVYASLRRAGFAGTALLAAAAAVSNLVIGTVATQTAWNDLDEAGARRAMHDHLRDRADDYPTLAALPDTTVDSRDAQFKQARDALIAGLAAHLDRL